MVVFTPSSSRFLSLGSPSNSKVSIISFICWVSPISTPFCNRFPSMKTPKCEHKVSSSSGAMSSFSDKVTSMEDSLHSKTPSSFSSYENIPSSLASFTSFKPTFISLYAKSMSSQRIIVHSFLHLMIMILIDLQLFIVHNKNNSLVSTNSPSPIKKHIQNMYKNDVYATDFQIY